MGQANLLYTWTQLCPDGYALGQRVSWREKPHRSCPTASTGVVLATKADAQVICAADVSCFGVGCVDAHAECFSRGEFGDCVTNSSWMQVNCPVTCGTCGRDNASHATCRTRVTERHGPRIPGAVKQVYLQKVRDATCYACHTYSIGRPRSPTKCTACRGGTTGPCADGVCVKAVSV